MEIIVKFEDKVIERIICEQKRVSIGRVSDNDIVLDNQGVSRRHASIIQNGQTVEIIDNESLSGSFVNNRKISAEILKDGDVIGIGKYQLVYNAQVRQGTTPETPTYKVPPKGAIIGIAEVSVQEMALTKEVTSIGKHGADIQVEGWWLDAVHATITRTARGFRLNEVGKRNKTSVNGKMVHYADLHDGDIVQVGRGKFRFVVQ